MEKDEMLNNLKAILLEDDRKLTTLVQKELEGIRGDLVKEQQIKKIVDANNVHLTENFNEVYKDQLAIHRQESLAQIQDNFSEYFSEKMSVAIKKQVAEDRDTLIDALYPIMGKMIRKYISSEMAKLNEGIDKRINNTFSGKVWKQRFKAWFSGAKKEDILLSELTKPQIEEVFIVQKDSGLLLGSFSRNETVDQDMIAGMLTAIRSFVEDAFKKEGQNLETIEYQNYKIVLIDFHTYYAAVSISGNVNAAFRDDLSKKMMTFVERYVPVGIKNVTKEVSDKISKDLSSYLKD